MKINLQINEKIKKERNIDTILTLANFQTFLSLNKNL